MWVHWGHSRQDGEEVLDGAFSGIALADVGWDKLVVALVGFDSGAEGCAGFIVEDVDDWG